MTNGGSGTRWDDLGKLILRVTVAGLLIFHGISKLKAGIGWMAGPLGAAHLPFALGYGVYVAEVLAPVLLVLGIFTRPAAVIIASLKIPSHFENARLLVIRTLPRS